MRLDKTLKLFSNIGEENLKEMQLNLRCDLERIFEYHNSVQRELLKKVLLKTRHKRNLLIFDTQQRMTRKLRVQENLISQIDCFDLRALELLLGNNLQYRNPNRFNKELNNFLVQSRRFL